LLRKRRNKPESEKTEQSGKMLFDHGGYRISFLTNAPSAEIPRAARW
jgi:hypothetical protein